MFKFKLIEIEQSFNINIIIFRRKKSLKITNIELQIYYCYKLLKLISGIDRKR